MLKHHKEVDAAKEMRDAFKVFDKDNKGEVSTSELRAVLTSMGEKLTEEEVRLSVLTLYQYFRLNPLSELVTRVERFM